MSKLLILLMIAVANHSSSAIEIIPKDTATRIVSVPYTISSPGIYYLANNIFSTANAEISITASNVVLDLGGHTLQVSSTDACIRINGPTWPSWARSTVWSGAGHQSFNIIVQNGTLVNNVAGCIYMGGTHGCVIDHITALAAGQCAFLDEQGAANRISNCTFISGNPSSIQGPLWSHGPSFSTVFLLASGDLFESNIITSGWIHGGPLASTGSATGADIGNLGNVIRNNVIWSVNNPQGNDAYNGNLYPGTTARQ